MNDLPALRRALFGIVPGDNMPGTIRDDFQNVYKSVKVHIDSCLDALKNFRRNSFAEREVLEFCIYLNPIIKQFRKGLDLPYIQFLKVGLDNKLLIEDFNIVKLIQKIKNIESTTKKKIPVHELHRLANNEELEMEEKQEIRDWLSALDEARTLLVSDHKEDEENPFVRVRYFHRFLKLLCQEIKGDLVAVEVELQKLGCKTFKEPDPCIIEKREKIVKERTVVLDDKTYILNDILSNQEKDLNEPIEFEISDDPFHKLVIYQNEAIRDITFAFEAKEQYGVIKPQERGKDNAGMIARVERCYDFLNEIIWTSKTDELEKEDDDNAIPIVGLLAGFLAQPCTPRPLSPKNFAFNEEDDLRALITMKMKRKSFESLVTFAWECAAANVPVFKHLLVASGLSSSIYANEYGNLLKNALAGIADREIKNSNVAKCRKQFCTTMMEVKESLLKAISARYEIINTRVLEEAIHEAMLAIHKSDGSTHLILDDFESRCNMLILCSLRPPIQIMELYSIREKIIEEIANSDVYAFWENEQNYFNYGVFNQLQIEEMFSLGKVTRNLYLINNTNKIE